MLNNKWMWFIFELVAHFNYILFNQVEKKKTERR